MMSWVTTPAKDAPVLLEILLCGKLGVPHEEVYRVSSSNAEEYLFINSKEGLPSPSSRLLLEWTAACGLLLAVLLNLERYLAVSQAWSCS